MSQADLLSANREDVMEGEIASATAVIELPAAESPYFFGKEFRIFMKIFSIFGLTFRYPIFIQMV